MGIRRRDSGALSALSALRSASGSASAAPGFARWPTLSIPGGDAGGGGRDGDGDGADGGGDDAKDGGDGGEGDYA